jgi:hypothetical protein
MEDEEKKLLGMSDQEFREAIEESRPSVVLVAKWFMARGYVVRIPETRVRPTCNERERYRDKGDFFIVLPDKELRIEVKQLSHRFDSMGSLYPNMIVNAVKSWDKADPKPYMHIMVNGQKTHFAFVRSKTSHHWFKKEEWDSRKKGYRWFYKCPKKFFEIREL